MTTKVLFDELNLTEDLICLIELPYKDAEQELWGIFSDKRCPFTWGREDNLAFWVEIT